MVAQSHRDQQKVLKKECIAVHCRDSMLLCMLSAFADSLSHGVCAPDSGWMTWRQDSTEDLGQDKLANTQLNVKTCGNMRNT